jgi:L-ascorbate metabolism protein UlaG (beta-lactamase superfamily)
MSVFMALSLYLNSAFSAEDEEVENMLENLHWLGHASFRLDASKTIYFDPWKLSKGAKLADIIFITHDHFDHFSLEDVKLISTEDTVIVTDKSVGRQVQGKVNCKEVKALSPGETAAIGDVNIQAVASYNIGKEFHTKDTKKLGFIVKVDGVSVYHAGDTDNIPEMKTYRCDIALLPVSGTYVMTADEAAEAALAIKPKIAVPMHYGEIVGSGADAKEFSDLLKEKIEVKILAKER